MVQTCEWETDNYIVYLLNIKVQMNFYSFQSKQILVVIKISYFHCCSAVLIMSNYRILGVWLSCLFPLSAVFECLFIYSILFPKV